MYSSAQSGAALLLDGLARLILLASLALLPVFVLPFQWVALAQSKMFFLAIAIALAALLWMIARLLEGVMHLPRGILPCAVLLLPLAYLASAVAAGFPVSGVLGGGVEQDTLAAVIIWFSIFALTLVLFSGHAAGMRTGVRAFAIGCLALFVFEALYIFFPTWFSLGGFLQGETANLLGSWHDLGILAALALACALMLLHSSIFAGGWRILAYALGVAATFVLLIVHFTDVLWGAAALSAIAGLIAVRADLSAGLALVRAFTRSAVFFAFTAVFVLAALFGTTLWDKLPPPLLINGVEVRPSWQGTFDVGRQSLEAPTQVLFGTGPNSFVREWGMHKPEGVNLTPFWNADFSYGVGIIPTSAFTAGLVGLIAWAAIVLALLGLSLRYLREAPSRPMFAFLLVGSLFLVIFHMLYTPGIVVTALTFACMGLLGAFAAGDRPARTLELNTIMNSVVFTIVTLLAIPIIIAAGLVGREVVSNVLVNRAAATYRVSGDVAVAGRMLGRSLAVSPRNDRAHRAAAELGLVEFGQLAAQGQPQTNEALRTLQETLQKTIQHGLTAVEIDNNYQNWLLLAQVYSSFAEVNIEGAYEQAATTYERAFEANPTNPMPKLRLAQLAATRGDLAAAREHLTAALALKSDFAAAHFLLSQVSAAEGKGDEAVQAAAAAVQLVPEDPLGWFNLGHILYAGEAYSDAASSFEQAIARANDYSNALFFLSASYYKLGRVEESIAVLERVAALNPSETWVQDALAAVRAGEDPFAADAQ